jgi:hypothetical protein
MSVSLFPPSFGLVPDAIQVRPELKGLAAGQRQLVALAKMEHAREREEILKKKAQEQSARLTSQQVLLFSLSLSGCVCVVRTGIHGIADGRLR